MKLFIKSCRTVLQIIRDIDGFLTWITTIWHPKQKLQGSCKKRGVCCKNIAVGTPLIAQKIPLLMHIINWWFTFVYNFKLKGLYNKQNVLIYSCNYLKDNKCSIYWRRPYICRQYPHSKRIGVRTMPGCGFKFNQSNF